MTTNSKFSAINRSFIPFFFKRTEKRTLCNAVFMRVSRETVRLFVSFLTHAYEKGKIYKTKTFFLRLFQKETNKGIRTAESRINKGAEAFVRLKTAKNKRTNEFAGAAMAVFLATAFSIVFWSAIFGCWAFGAAN